MAILITILLGLAGAIIPTVFYVYLVYWLDRYEREPLWLVAIAFFWGAFPAILLALVPEVLFDSVLEPLLGDTMLYAILSASVSPPLFEESAKGIFLIALLLIFWHEFGDPLDGLVYGAMVGFGFAMTENFFYSLSAADDGGVGGQLFNIFLRSGLFGLNHAFFTAWMGLALGWARSHRGIFHRIVVPVLGWLAAMLFHALHNLGATLAEVTACLSLLAAIVSDWGGILVMTMIAFWLIGHQRQWLVTELQPEVAAGLLTQSDFDTLTSSRRRAAARFRALTSQGFSRYRRLGRFYALATELAFRKRALHAFGEERGNSAEITKLRMQLEKMKSET